MVDCFFFFTWRLIYKGPVIVDFTEYLADSKVVEAS